MSGSLRRLILVLALLPVLVLVVALLYMGGMAQFEQSPRSFIRSLEWAAETLTTTGYGSDNTWQHPIMVLFVVTTQVIGSMLVFLVVPIALVPFLERRFEVKLPRHVEPLSEHVIVFHYGPAVATLLEEFEESGVPVLVVEEKEAIARRLIENGHRVLAMRQSDDALDRAHLSSARALIANGSDDQNAALIVGARQAGFTGEALALVEEPVYRRPMMLAGATAVFTPRHVLGAALAARASERIAPAVAGIQQLGDKLVTMEVRIQPGSSLAGQTLAEAGIGRDTGATVLAQWVGGELQAPVTGGDRMEIGSILVIAGGHESVERVEALCQGSQALDRQGPFVVGGCGEVGEKVVQLLRDANEAVRVIDRVGGPGVDVVADVLEPDVLEELDLASAKAVILALDSDTATLFATLMVRDLAPGVPVIARVNQAENVDSIHGAGADFALSLSQVSGQILSRRLLGEEAIAFDPALKLLRAPVGSLRGGSPRDTEIRRRSGCSVVAIERGETLSVELPDEFRFEEGDYVYVCGSSQAIRRFRETFGVDA